LLFAFCTMENGWIVDRLPTEADGDDEECVRLANCDRTDYLLAHWSYVHPGAPWQHTIFWEPPAEPDRIAALEQRVAKLEAFKQAAFPGHD
jgi:hypothetical protein